jgi:hypothetical protein
LKRGAKEKNRSRAFTGASELFEIGMVIGECVTERTEVQIKNRWYAVLWKNDAIDCF